MASEFIEVLGALWQRVAEIVQQPVANKEMLWMLLPLIAALCLIEFYFSIHKDEELGWNTAIGNSLVLFFVGMNLCAFLQANGMLVSPSSLFAGTIGVAAKKTMIAYFIILESGILMLLNFFHLASKRFAFGISSSLILNFMGIMATIFVYTPVTKTTNLLTWVSYPAILAIFAIMLLFFVIIWAIAPTASDEDDGE